MKYFYLLPILFVLTSCQMVNDLLEFKLNYSKEVSVDANTIIKDTVTIKTDPIKTDIENHISVNNITKDNIEEIIPLGLVLQLKTPNTINLDFLDGISAYIAAKGLPETKVAWKDTIPENTDKMLVLNVTSRNLKAYLNQDEIYFKIKVSSNKAITPEIKLELKSKFLVKASVLN